MYPESRQIRETHSLIPKIPREIHREIHRECSEVPSLSYYVLSRTVALFEPDGTNTLVDAEKLMSSIEGASRHYKTKPIERELAYLAIEAIDSQLPFIREGLRY